MKIITWLFFGTLGYLMVYGTSYTGNEIMLAVFVLGGFFTFLIGLFIAFFWVFVTVAVIVIGYLAYDWFNSKRKQKERLARMRDRI